MKVTPLRELVARDRSRKEMLGLLVARERQLTERAVCLECGALDDMGGPHVETCLYARGPEDPCPDCGQKKYHQRACPQVGSTWRERTKCPTCAGPLTFDPSIIGSTVGGLMRRGWLVCACGGVWLSKQGRAVESWRLATSGISVETGMARLRIETSEGSLYKKALAERVMRLPDLEAEVEILRAKVAHLEEQWARRG